MRDEINELIRSTHGIYRKLGRWDDFPMCGNNCEYCLVACVMNPERHAYLAKKLDHIVFDLSDALRARYDDYRFQDFKRARLVIDNTTDPNWENHLTHLWVGTEDSYLVSALSRVLDLLGHLGGIYGGGSDESPSYRLLIRRCNDSALDIEMGMSRAKGRLVACIKSIIRIAEISKIDWRWNLGVHHAKLNTVPAMRLERKVDREG